MQLTNSLWCLLLLPGLETYINPAIGRGGASTKLHKTVPSILSCRVGNAEPQLTWVSVRVATPPDILGARIHIVCQRGFLLYLHMIFFSWNTEQCDLNSFFSDGSWLNGK